MPYRPSPEAEAIVAGQHGDPFAFLGMHKRSAGLYVRAFLPDAEEMAVVDAASGEVAGRGAATNGASSTTSTGFRRCWANSTCTCWSKAIT